MASSKRHVRGALEKRQSRDTRKEHKSIPVLRLLNPMPITGVESASLLKYFASRVPRRSF
jgi:hypothetical protein